MADVPAAASTFRSGHAWTWLAIALFVVLVRGLFIDVMDIDASQYASIAMEMLQRGHWLQVTYHQLPYLDKPPLLFWTSALSFAAFGVLTWAYKLPSLLAVGAAAYAVYRFCLLYYARSVARIAAFILASSVGVMLMANDVRTDALLMGASACATWQLAAWLGPSRSTPRHRITHALLGGLFVGLAMLAKGPIGLVVPAAALGTHVRLHREWKRLWSWQLLAGIATTGVVLFPMCWGLYRQFGATGLRFFFWDQSFGRITGATAWRNDTSPLYFVHTFLWVFLPWSLLFIGALWRRGVELIRAWAGPQAGDEGFSLGGFVLPFLALSLSHYKLPHYIFAVLPWAAVLTARWLGRHPETDGKAIATNRAWWLAQYLVSSVLAASLVWLLIAAFPVGSLLAWLGAIGAFGLLIVRLARQPFPASADAIVQRGVIAAIGAGFVLNFHVFPAVLHYQASSEAAHAARELGIPMERIVSYRKPGDALSVYSGRLVPQVAAISELRQYADSLGELFVFTDSLGRVELDAAGMDNTTVVSLQDFPVARLSTAFLFAGTRSRSLRMSYLLRIPGQDSVATTAHVSSGLAPRWSPPSR
jgi:4-amino-4-deoxy-L-arabinose transferase-like glycosyltransferase